jgi:hypothetical protein
MPSIAAERGTGRIGLKLRQPIAAPPRSRPAELPVNDQPGHRIDLRDTNKTLAAA